MCRVFDETVEQAREAVASLAARELRHTIDKAILNVRKQKGRQVLAAHEMRDAVGTTGLFTFPSLRHRKRSVYSPHADEFRTMALSHVQHQSHGANRLRHERAAISQPS